MKFRPLALSRLEESDLEYDITKIKDIIDEVNKVTIIFKDKTKEVLKKADYFYPHWDSFREQINRVFLLGD